MLPVEIGDDEPSRRAVGDGAPIRAQTIRVHDEVAGDGLAPAVSERHEVHAIQCPLPREPLVEAQLSRLLDSLRRAQGEIRQGAIPGLLRVAHALRVVRQRLRDAARRIGTKGLRTAAEHGDVQHVTSVARPARLQDGPAPRERAAILAFRPGREDAVGPGVEVLLEDAVTSGREIVESGRQRGDAGPIRSKRVGGARRAHPDEPAARLSGHRDQRHRCGQPDSRSHRAFYRCLDTRHTPKPSAT